MTAEGVETKEMADSLSAMGCTSLQGFYFAPPLTLSQFERCMEPEIFCFYDLRSRKGQ